MIWILVTVHILLAKSEKLVGRRRWLSSYDKCILRTLEVLMYFLQGSLCHAFAHVQFVYYSVN